MKLHKSLIIQIILLVSLTIWNVLIGFRCHENWVTATALFLALFLLILIPFAAAIKARDDWNDFFSVFILILHPLHSYFIIQDFHSNLLYQVAPDIKGILIAAYLFQSLVVINYLYLFLKDYYRQYSFYGITSLSVLNHGLVICSLIVIIINAMQFQSDKLILNDLISKDIKPMSVKITDSPNAFFFPHLSITYSTIKIKPSNSKEFLLPIRERVIMEYQGNLFESNYIEKKAFSNELHFRSPKDTFVIEIIQPF